MALTAQENLEVAKVVNASTKLGLASAKMGAYVSARGDNDPFFTPNSVGGTIHQIIASTGGLVNVLVGLLYIGKFVFDRAEYPRAEWLKNGVDALARALRELAPVPANLRKINDANANAAAGYVDEALSLLNSVNTMLPYADPLPPDFPRIVGPHGHYDRAQGAAILSNEYISEGLFALSVYATAPDYPNTARANAALGLFYEHIGRAFNFWNRVIGVTARVLLPEDKMAIMGDSEASSHLRPESFFNALYAHELAMTAKDFPNFHGRPVGRGISASFAIMGQRAAVVIDEYLGKPGSEATGKKLVEKYNQFSTMWAALDEWSNANLLFFFEIPAPPIIVDPSQTAIIPPGTFDSESAKLDKIAADANGIAADAVATKASLKAREGNPV